MKLVPEYRPVERLYLSFVRDFFDTRFGYGRTISEMTKVALAYVDVEIFTSLDDLLHLQAALAAHQVDVERVTLNHDSPHRGILTEYTPIVAENDAGERIGLIFSTPSLDRAAELKQFSERLAGRMGLSPLDIGYPFATAGLSVSDDVVFLSQPHFDGPDGKEKRSFFTRLFPHQTFYVVPALAGDVTRDLDMYLWPIAPQTWVVSQYPEGSPQADSIAPALEILQTHGHTVHRVPGLEPLIYDDINTMPNYANGVLLNRAALVPAYNRPEDAIIVDVLENCGYEVWPIDCSNVILSNSGLHCISRTLPKRANLILADLR